MPKKLTCSQTFLYKDLVKRLTERGLEGDYLDSVKKNLIKIYKNPEDDRIYPVNFNRGLLRAFNWAHNKPYDGYWYRVYLKAYK